MNLTSERRYDFASAAIVALVVGLLCRLWAHLPVMQDSWYHLGVIRAFYEKGPTLQAWWEFAPVGRPHLYSPVFHLVNVTLLHLTPLSLVDLGRLYDVVTFPAVLGVGWLAARMLFGARAAFLTLLLLALNTALFFPCSLIMMPGTYALLLLPLMHVCVIRRKTILAALLLAVVCYLHQGVASIAFVSLLVFAVFRREYWRMVLVVVGIGVVAVSPWLLHLWRHRELLHAGVSNVPAFIPAFTVIGALLGISAVRKRAAPEPLAILSIIIASAMFFLTLKERVWIYGGFTFAILGGYGLDACAGRQLRWVIALLLVSCVSITPFFKRAHLRLGLPIPVQGMPVIMGTPLLALADWQRAEEAAKLPSAVADDVGALALWIKQNIPPDDILLIEDPMLSGYLFTLTGRRTTSGLWNEVYTYELKEKLAAYQRTAPGFIVLRIDRNEGVAVPQGSTLLTTIGRFGVFHRAP